MKKVNVIIEKYLGEETVAADVSVDADDVAMPMRRHGVHDFDECPVHEKVIDDDGRCPVCGYKYRNTNENIISSILKRRKEKKTAKKTENIESFVKRWKESGDHMMHSGPRELGMQLGSDAWEFMKKGDLKGLEKFADELYKSSKKQMKDREIVEFHFAENLLNKIRSTDN